MIEFHIMQKKNTNFQLLRSSTKIFDFNKPKVHLSDFKKNRAKVHLPPICNTPKPKSNIKCHQVNLGTVSIIKQEAARLRQNKVLVQNSLPNSNRSKLKLKTINWIISNYREEIDKLMDNYRLLFQYTNFKGGISYQNFQYVLMSSGLCSDKTLIDRLFWVFDENANGKIEPKEVMVGLELFRESTFQEKLEVFFDICDEDGSGDIDEEEFFNVLKLCVSSAKERKILKDSLHELFVAIDEDGNGFLTKSEIIKAATQSEALKSIIERSISVCQGADS